MSESNGTTNGTATPPTRLAFNYRDADGSVRLCRVELNVRKFVGTHLDTGKAEAFDVAQVVEMFGEPQARQIARRCLCGAREHEDCGCSSEADENGPSSPVAPSAPASTPDPAPEQGRPVTASIPTFWLAVGRVLRGWRFGEDAPGLPDVDGRTEP